MSEIDGLGAADDDFHRDSSDPWQTEGSWWCFHDRDRRLMGWVYHLTRLNLGYASGGVWVWDDTAELFHEVPYYRNVNHQPVGAGADLREFTWPDGVSLRTLEPLQRYRLTYADPGRLELDLDYSGLMPPYLTGSGDPPRVTRLDHPCRVTGTMVLHGEPIAIDCLGFRDHSWGIRPDTVPAGGPVVEPERLARRPVPYLWGTASAADAFFVMLGRGYLVRDGVRAALVEVDQTVERDPDTALPRRVTVRGRDDQGRDLVAVGDIVNRIVRPSASASVGCIALVDWDFDGVRCCGDIQDVWPIAEWSAYRSWQRRNPAAVQFASSSRSS